MPTTTLRQPKLTNFIFQSTKTYCHSVGLSCCFRQWRATSHCRLLHGYALEVKLIFECEALDNNNWCVDFGSLNPIKKWLESTFDHKLLVAEDDPHLHAFKNLEQMGLAKLVILSAVGCESLAKIIFNQVEFLLPGNTVQWPQLPILRSVEVREHAGNSALVIRK